MTASGRRRKGRIAEAFARARREGRPALIPYLTAGDPDLAVSRALVPALQGGGADIVEIGVPFSDPVADGSINQRSAERALRNGVNLGAVLALAGDLRGDGAPPLVLFTYFNPVHRMGLEAFGREVERMGLDGVLVTDLPPEEAGDLREILERRGTDLISLVSPTTSRDRLERLCAEARGFLYFISRTGVTGPREDLPESLGDQVRAARAICDLPIAVGFGISQPDQVRAAASYADGVVVGSALVRLIEEARGAPDLTARVEAFCRTLLGRS